MRIKTGIAVLALALVGAPLSAQGRATQEKAKSRTAGTVVRASDGRVVRTSDGTVVRSTTKIPPGQLPPKGMCRVWIEGVPPGQQPPVTDCATAERNRVANSRVIYGDRESFPGRGRGKFGTDDGSTSCSLRDAVVVGDRVVNVCRDDDDIAGEGKKSNKGKGKAKGSKSHNKDKHGSDRD